MTSIVIPRYSRVSSRKHAVRYRSLTLQMIVLKRIGVSAATLLIFTIGLVEMAHLVRFGHFFSFGLHADVLVRKADYGITGITKAY